MKIEKEKKKETLEEYRMKCREAMLYFKYGHPPKVRKKCQQS